ncbi:hypothetical protein AB1O29_004085, partial [Escherichia coli]|nr:hypothetical protein [Escherichia coli]EII7604768.1 hypothetical protein [Escherichia coli]EKH1584352.1 hypothetical protein [Escherichia coli]ELC4127423.1 hypothetical protein [Escherichia coli]HCP9309645.1 hypothetical protein [Escherichia coli]
MFGKGENLVATDYQMVRHPDTRSEKLRREVELAEALLKQREQDSDRYSGRED